MKTTEVIVEILVIGFGPVLVFTLLSGSMSSSTFEWILNLHPSLLLVVGSIFCYVAGIIVDRIADFAFSFYEDRIRADVLTNFGKKSVDFQGMRSSVYNETPHIMTWSEYGRIRIRVCRGWSLNTILLIVLYLWLNTQAKYSVSSLSLLLALSLLLFGCIFSWRQLTTSECNRIADEFSRLDKPDLP